MSAAEVRSHARTPHHNAPPNILPRHKAVAVEESAHQISGVVRRPAVADLRDVAVLYHLPWVDDWDRFKNVHPVAPSQFIDIQRVEPRAALGLQRERAARRNGRVPKGSWYLAHRIAIDEVCANRCSEVREHGLVGRVAPSRPEVPCWVMGGGRARRWEGPLGVAAAGHGRGERVGTQGARTGIVGDPNAHAARVELRDDVAERVEAARHVPNEVELRALVNAEVRVAAGCAGEGGGVTREARLGGGAPPWPAQRASGRGTHVFHKSTPSMPP